MISELFIKLKKIIQKALILDYCQENHKMTKGNICCNHKQRLILITLQEKETSVVKSRAHFFLVFFKPFSKLATRLFFCSSDKCLCS